MVTAKHVVVLSFLTLGWALFATACTSPSQPAPDDEAGGAGGFGGDDSAAGGSAAGGNSTGGNESAGQAGTSVPSLGGNRGTGGAAPSQGGGTRPAADAGAMDSMQPPPAAGETPPAGYVPAIMAVGYGGIRVLSRDNGLTWVKTAQLEAHGADDSALLVEVAYGHGTWIATYNKTFTSPDGVNWTERKPPCSINRVAYGNGMFVGICGTDAWTSPDALTWKKVGSFDPGNHSNILFAEIDKKFVYWSDDSHQSYSSADALKWTLIPNLTDGWVCDGVIKSRKACGNAFRGPGLWLKDDIFRSTDGVRYTRVYTDDSGNYPVWFAWGWAAPR